MWFIVAKYNYGTKFRCKKGKHKGKMVKYRYTNKKKSTKKMVLHRPRRR
jgi:hypothetical protein